MELHVATLTAEDGSHVLVPMHQNSSKVCHELCRITAENLATGSGTYVSSAVRALVGEIDEEDGIEIQ
jgi:hypothetical protein